MRTALLLLLLLACAVRQASCLNWKFWEMFYSKEEVPPTGLERLQSWDRADYDDIVKDTEDYLSFMETKASQIVSMVRTLENGGKGIYQVIRQIFAYNEGVNISDAIPKEEPETSIETVPIKVGPVKVEGNPKTAENNLEKPKPAEEPAEEPADEPAEEPAEEPEAKVVAQPPQTDANKTEAKPAAPEAVKPNANAAQEKPITTIEEKPKPVVEEKPAPTAEPKPSGSTTTAEQKPTTITTATATADPKPASTGNVKPSAGTTAKPAAKSTASAEHKSFAHRLVENSKNLIKGLFDKWYGQDQHAHLAARNKRNSEVLKMAHAYIASRHVVASTLKQPASAQPRRKQSRSASHSHKSASQSHLRAAPRHLLSEQSEQMAATWRSYFLVSEDMEKHVKLLQDLITRIKAPGLELASLFKSLPPKKERPQD